MERVAVPLTVLANQHPEVPDMRLCVAVAATIALAGCAYNVTLMPRDSGQTFTGELQGGGGGSGTMTVRLNGVTCTGPAARVASNQSFGFINTYGRNSAGMTATRTSTVSVDGDATVKAILSCTNSTGLRCEMTGRGATGGGICLDDSGRVFDILAVRK